MKKEQLCALVKIENIKAFMNEVEMALEEPMESGQIVILGNMLAELKERLGELEAILKED